MTLQTRYEFTLPRGYVDAQGVVHRDGVMRLATARDELEPLRDPMIDGPDDPRLTIVVLARVVERLGTLELVTAREIEGLFAADLAFLQDFYGVINFGSQAEYEELLAAQRDAAGPVTTSVPRDAGRSEAGDASPASESSPPSEVSAPSGSGAPASDPSTAAEQSEVPAAAAAPSWSPVPGRRSAIEEIPSDGR
nr:hypothetical protein [uncultured Actinotalea sp.]